jgi:hypothetical protein
MGMADRADQVVHGLVAAGEVVVVLDADRDPVRRRAAGAFSEGRHHHVPLRAVGRRGMLVAGVDPDQVAAQLGCDAGEVGDVLDLDLAMRHLAVLEVGGEVGIARQADALEPAALEAAAHAGAGRQVVVENGNAGRLATSMTPS